MSNVRLRNIPMPTAVALSPRRAARASRDRVHVESPREHIQHQRRGAGVGFTSATAGKSSAAEAATTCARSGASTLALTPSSWAQSAPNPSIEGMPKRLRLLCTPHVKR
jgi:sarcosine oxidase gamma subunit